MRQSFSTPCRVLVTGAAGFVGRHLLAELLAHLPEGGEVFACSRDGRPTLPGTRDLALDLADAASVSLVMRTVGPTHVVHLAAISSLGEAGKNPGLAWHNNVTGTLSLCRSLAEACPGARLVAVSSSEVYGGSAAAVALDEDTPLAPLNVYACTKAAADELSGLFGGQGLSVIRARPFNHIGPGQSERFVVAAFAAQIARIEAGLQDPVLKVGNLEAARDFLDVRDVAAAYRAMLFCPDPLPPRTIFNVASGQPRRIRAVLDDLLAQARRPVTVELDPARMRPSETPLLLGDAGRLREILGWAPAYAWERTLGDILDDWRARLAQA